MDVIFPYEKVRNVQHDLINELKNAITTRMHLIAHAPTGLGKTIATLYVSLPYAIENALTILFLTSKHTHHKIAIETLRDMQRKNNLQFSAADIIGKKWMCTQMHVTKMSSGDFSEFCRHMVETKTCEFYMNTKNENKLTPKAQIVVEKLKTQLPHTEDILYLSAAEKLCPYEVALEIAKKATVIVGDYYYVFNPHVQEAFFRRTNKELYKCILIVDEAHNLPSRIRELATEHISVLSLKKAILEAKKFHYTETISTLSQINDVLLKLSRPLRLGEEKLVKKEMFVNLIEQIDDYSKIVDDLTYLADVVRDVQRQSYIGGVAKFLAVWKGPDKGFARILSIKEYKKEAIITLTYRCLDPSIISENIVNKSYSTIMMSGTLTPTSMYKDLLGFNKAIEREYASPFPEYNRLNLVVPLTTTKYTMRNKEQFQKIGIICSDIIDTIPGNSIIFFPSYLLREYIIPFLKTTKKLFIEKPEMTKEERYKLVEQFKQCKDSGAAILGVVGGSFGEGVDLPGDYLKGVVVVGLPLEPPDLETKELISYLDDKFGCGWDYGYLFPAFNKVLQNAGRCIRSETDKGVIVFLDHRYIWPVYRRCFPQEWEIKVSKNYTEEIESFFKRNKKQ